MDLFPHGKEREERCGKPHPWAQTGEIEPNYPRSPLLPPPLRHSILCPYHPQAAVEHDQRQLSVVAGRQTVARVVQHLRVGSMFRVSGSVLRVEDRGGQGVGWRGVTLVTGTRGGKEWRLYGEKPGEHVVLEVIVLTLTFAPGVATCTAPGMAS